MNEGQCHTEVYNINLTSVLSLELSHSVRQVLRSRMTGGREQRAATPMKAAGPMRDAAKNIEYMLCAFANISEMLWDTMMKSKKFDVAWDTLDLSVSK